LLDLVVQRGRSHRGPKQSAAGSTWRFPSDAKLEVTDPSGARLKPNSTSADSQHLIPELTGRYAVKLADDIEHRLVVLDIDELTLLPRAGSDTFVAAQSSGDANLVDASPQWAVLLLGLFAAEMLLRTHGDKLLQRWRAARAARDSGIPTPRRVPLPLSLVPSEIGPETPLRAWHRLPESSCG
jgi:hypothetical protein